MKMTLPDERLRSVRYAREFLRDLLDPKKTPRVSKEIRQRAYRVLKHFPGECDMQQASKKAPKVFGPYDEE
jgi:hypothetical protein